MWAENFNPTHNLEKVHVLKESKSSTFLEESNKSGGVTWFLSRTIFNLPLLEFQMGRVPGRKYNTAKHTANISM
jgi:hypothetical protein